MSSLEPDRLVVIGASTGGPGHIQKILRALTPGFRPAIIIAQHMDPGYVGSFVAFLKTRSSLDIYEVGSDPLVVKPSSVYVCSRTSLLARKGREIDINPITDTAAKGYNPNVSALFESAAPLAQKINVMGVILTGIGDDGARGCSILSQAGGKCMAESRESAIVYGMPKRAYELNPQIEVKHIDEIIERIRLFGA